MILCARCQQRDTCKKLCDKAEKYISKDHVAQRELVFADCKTNPCDHENLFTFQELTHYYTATEINLPFLTEIENKVTHAYYFQGLRQKKIAFNYRITLARVKWYLHTARRKMLKHKSTV